MITYWLKLIVDLSIYGLFANIAGPLRMWSRKVLGPTSPHPPLRLDLRPKQRGNRCFQTTWETQGKWQVPYKWRFKAGKKHLQMVHVPSQCSFTEQVQRSGACKSQPITKTKAIDLSKPHAEDIKMIDITVTATTQLAHTYIHACMHAYIHTKIHTWLYCIC